MGTSGGSLWSTVDRLYNMHARGPCMVATTCVSPNVTGWLRLLTLVSPLPQHMPKPKQVRKAQETLRLRPLARRIASAARD